MKNVLMCVALAVGMLVVADQAWANPCPPGNPPTNCAPPTGAILDLAGTAVPHTYTAYSVDFVATATTTNLSFAFREDPAFLELDNVSVTTGGGSNLLVNGNFESGPVGSQAPTGWTFLNSFGATFAGVVTAGCGVGGSICYFDGAVQAYDGITQGIATTIGSTYHISFQLNDNGSLTTFSQLSTNGNTTGTGGNGIDLLVYAGAIPTLAVPEPASVLLLGSGLIGLAAWRRKQAA